MNQADAATRAESVGSLLRSAQVLEAAAVAAPDRDEAVTALLDSAVLDAIRLQQDAGLDVITDGEVRRRQWAETSYFLDCFEPVGTTRALNWRVGPAVDAEAEVAPALPQAHYPAVVRRVSHATRLGDPSADYAFLAEHAGTRTKYTLAAPSYHRRHWSEQHSRAVYGSCEEFLFEIRDYEREVVEKVIALGCDYVQLDAPNYGSLCDPDTRTWMASQGRDVDEELAFDAELDNSLFEGLSGVTRALHICRGNAPGGRWHSVGGYGAISAALFPRLDFDRLLLEYDTERAGTFGPLADARPDTAVVLGLLSSKSAELEPDSEIEARVSEAAAIKPLQQLALSTQCGFASAGGGYPLTADDQQLKLEAVGRIARRIWAP
jgi:5-methyltetrahydropteroyltriglutamate--homocysteine methyltransferase